MAGDRSFAVFLHQVDHKVLRLGPREHLAVERLLRSHAETDEAWTHGALRAAVASLLARNPEQWTQVTKLYDQHLGGDDPATDARPPPDAERIVRLDRPRRGQRLGQGIRRAQATLVRALRNAPRWLWSVAFVLAIGAALAVPLARLVTVKPLIVVSPPIRWSPPPPPPPASPDFELVKVEAERPQIDVLGPPRAGRGVLAALVGISLLLLALGARLVRLAPTLRRERRAQLTRRRQATDAARAALEESKAAAGRPLEIRYRVERYLPVSRQAMLDSAGLLGRLVRHSRGVELDAEATLARTVAAAGRFSPVRARRFRHQEILVLVDVEQGDHPWLGGFRRLLAAWAAQGIVLRRYDFHHSPDSLVAHETREPIVIDELARRTDGLPLILFARHLDPRARRKDARWPSHLGVWPRRVWLDPDPRQHDKLPPARRWPLAQLQRLGLPRFHLSDEGAVGLARHLISGGEGPVSSGTVPLPPLPRPAPAGSGGPLAEALRKWALAASLVPDPTWDQLEAIRRHFPELHQVLDGPCHLQRLLEWVARETAAHADIDVGRGLDIPEPYQDDWLQAQRRLEQEVPAERRFETRARQLLLEQLASTEPKDALDRQWWRFKRALHRAVLEPKKAGALLAWIYDAPIAHEAGRWVAQELGRHEAGAGVGMSRADRETLRARAGRLDRIPLRALLRGQRKLWRRAFLAAAGASLGLAMLLGLVADPIAHFFTEERQRPSGAAPVFELVETRDPTRPLMVTLAGDTFQMGSASSEWDDERPVHPVEITSFQISKTEITVAQYRACFEVGTCAEPETGDSCNWGQDDRDDHPVNCVSWTDARTYAAWVGARLPSEAEWEYAARSQGLERAYPWGDDEADCERAVISTPKEGDGCGKGSTWPVCAKTSGNTDQGLCDMAGNVWEWVEDDWHSNYEGAPEDEVPWIQKPQRAAVRVLRGGSWGSDPRFARVAFRVRNAPSGRSGDVGFRVVRSLPSAL